MESTTKANSVKANFTRGIRDRLVRNAAFIAAAFLLGHAPIMDEMFPAAIAFMVYMVSRDSIYLYLAAPCALGIFFCISRGCDSWGEMLSLIVCSLLFSVFRKAKFELWHRAVISASVSMTCISVVRLLMSTAYKTSIQTLIFEGVLVAFFLFLTDAFAKALEKKEGGIPAVTAAVAASLSMLCGIGADFIIWPAVIFLVMCFFVYTDTGNALIAASAAGMYAFLVGQTQWGMMITIVIGVCAASFFSRFGNVAACMIFAAVCIAMRSAGGGVVLGIDNYCLAVGFMSFASVNWKFGKFIRKIIGIFAGADETGRDAALRAAEFLDRQAFEMRERSSLYSTYVDSRSALAIQFDVAGKIMEDTGRNVKAQEKKRIEPEYKFDVDIGMSQCAAAGDINGDCCGWEDIGGGKTAMMISDGMGKGKKAAAESLMVTKTVMSLLKSGAGAELTLKMINTIMIMKDDGDSFATVDLAIADRRTGRVRFYKTGAAPTLIKRKNSIEEIRLSTVPLGIVNGLKMEYTETFMKKGDMMIMMSDGVSDGALQLQTAAGGNPGGIDLIKEILVKIRSENPQTVSDILINRSADSYIGRERDDLTVLAVKLT